MMDGVRVMEPEKRQRFLRNVKHSATILLGLINDILDLSKIEAGRMEVHVDRVDIVGVVEEVVETMRVSADQKRSTIGVKVEPDLPEVWVDVVKVRQILQNLISNAIKYSDDDATIEVAVSRVSTETTGLGLEAFEIAVADNGRGIAPDKLPGIFDEYRQAHGNESSGSGTGLGLAIVSKFSELQGGRVTAESEPGTGSTFRVWLPVDARHWDSEKR
jgi:signal transduction histidine kinase